MEFHDYYHTLGVSRDADTATIKKAYRRKAREFHPDRNSAADAEDQFKRVQEAWEVLQDDEKRKAYDQLGANWKEGQNFRPPPGWDGFSSGGGVGGGGFSDFFETLFGGGHGFRTGGGRAGFKAGGDAGFGGFGGFEDRGGSSATQEVETTISLEEAYSGTTRELQRPGMSSLKVKIPAGTTSGTRMRINAGGPTGTVILSIKIRPHAKFSLDERNVSCDLPLAPWEAALGAKVKVPTLGGVIEMKIPEGSQSGQRLRLKGRGLPGKDGAGDQFIRLQVRYPAPLNDAQKELLQQWAESAQDYDPRA